MDAIVTAGGIPQPDDPLYVYTQGSYKALLDVSGKPMIQWVLDGLTEAKTIENIFVIGIPENSPISSPKISKISEDNGGMFENVRKGVKLMLEVHPSSNHVLLVSSDIPAIRGYMVDWVVENAMQTDEDIYYNVIPRSVMEARFPTSKRSYTKLKDIEVCGGDMNVIRSVTASANDELWEKIIASRKNVFKQAALIGFDTLVLLLLKKITLDQAVTRVTKKLSISGRPLICPYAEVGMDVDKPHQLEIIRADISDSSS
jgi:GTP:adenosylcobinamide-phosphate guanylyltransferase